MKISQPKIEYLVGQLLDMLSEIDGVFFQGNDAQLHLAMQEIITEELMIEELLDAEIHKMLQAHKYEITMERANYDELFKKMKQRLIHERKLVL